MHSILLAALLLASSAAFAEDVAPIAIEGETEEATKESLLDAAGKLAAPPKEARYIEISFATEALHLLETDGTQLTSAFCGLDEGEGDRRIDGVDVLRAEGQTDKNIRYRLAFDLGSVREARVWTDLACQYTGSGFTLVLRGHFVAKDLSIVEGYDVWLTAVAP
jgi:hypothetical protein